MRRLIAQFCIAFPELIRALGDRDSHRIFFDEAVQGQHIQARCLGRAGSLMAV